MLLERGISVIKNSKEQGNRLRPWKPPTFHGEVEETEKNFPGRERGHVLINRSLRWCFRKRKREGLQSQICFNKMKMRKDPFG